LQVPCVSACCATYNQNSATLALSAGSAQSPLQPVLLLRPTGILCLRFLFESVPLGLDCRHPLMVLPFTHFQRCLRPGNCLIALLALSLPGGLFLPALISRTRTVTKRTFSQGRKRPSMTMGANTSLAGSIRLFR